MSKALVIKLILYYSSIYGIDGNTAVAVAQIESGFNSKMIGSVGEIGIFQLRPEFVTEYSRDELFDPVNNIKAGIKRLKEVKKTCIHKENNDWLVCYNYGNTNAKKVKHPSLFPYVKKVNLAMREAI